MTSEGTTIAAMMEPSSTPKPQAFIPGPQHFLASEQSVARMISLPAWNIESNGNCRRFLSFGRNLTRHARGSQLGGCLLRRSDFWRQVGDYLPSVPRAGKQSRHAHDGGLPGILRNFIANA